MPSYNRVMLMGNLVRDPELRYTPAGMAVAEFAIAVNRQWSSKTGEKKEEVSFFDIEVWARQAETCAEYLKKGRPVFVEGRLTQKRWETPEGQKRNRVVITGDRVVFLGGGGGGTGRGGTPAPMPDSQDAPPPEVSDAPPPPEDDVPF